jgi:hypothetical protein
MYRYPQHGLYDRFGAVEKPTPYRTPCNSLYLLYLASRSRPGTVSKGETVLGPLYGDEEVGA